jgi:hypothetical protein
MNKTAQNKHYQSVQPLKWFASSLLVWSRMLACSTVGGAQATHLLLVVSEQTGRQQLVKFYKYVTIVVNILLHRHLEFTGLWAI